MTVYILGYMSAADRSIARIFSHAVTCLFVFLMVSLDEGKCSVLKSPVYPHFYGLYFLYFI